jgi:hypothetical protein
MNCRTLRRRRAHLGAPEPAAAAGKFAPSSHAPMVGNEKATAAIAAQLRAQIPCSTDPERRGCGSASALAAALKTTNVRFGAHEDSSKTSP